MEKTTSGEPTFGVEKYKTVAVIDSIGTMVVAHHDGDTWWEGHHNETHEIDGQTITRPRVQLEFPPVKLAD